MAKAAGLKSLTVYEHDTGNRLFWEQALKKFIETKPQ